MRRLTLSVALFLATTILAVATFAIVGCSDEPQTAQPQPKATPAIPTSAALEPVVHRFYHAPRQGKIDQAYLLGSPNFQKYHRWKDFYDSFASMDDPDEQIDDVKGSRVEYTLTYSNISDDKKSKILWKRHGSWTLAHGSQGWMLDDGSIEDDTIVGIIGSDGRRYDVSNDEVMADLSHVYTVSAGEYSVEFSYSRTSNGGWKTAFIKSIGPPTPEPVPTNPPYDSTQPAEPVLTPIPYVPAPAVPAPNVSCDEDSIDTVADDGSVITLLSGTVYSVDAGEEATASAWVAGDDVLICDDDKIINKDENGETVEVAPAN